MNVTPLPRRSGFRWFVALASVPVIALAGGAAWLHVSGTPVMDEWVCSDGEVPVRHTDGGSSCITEGSTPGPGETLDPFGNRPMTCHERWGWTEVYPLEVNRADPLAVVTECVRDGSEVPAGWEPVPDGWEPDDGRPLGIASVRGDVF